MMLNQLTLGTIEKIMDGLLPNRPVVQVLGTKKIPGGPCDRYRLLLNDGKYTHSSAMLANQLNHLITNGELDNFTVIQLDRFMCNFIQPDKRVIIILEVTVLTPGAECGHKLGDPKPFNKAVTSTATSQQSNDSGVGRSSVSTLSNRSMSSAPRESGAAPATATRAHPINTLTPYQNRWQIRARLTQKTAIRTWSNSRGEGKLFSMNWTDESGEIRATAFNEAVDKYYELLDVNKVYLISKGTLKTANKQYSSVDNDYEMTFNHDTTVTPCDDDTSLPSINFNFTPIKQLGDSQPGTTVDVIGIVMRASDVSTIIAKASNKEVVKRELTIVDKSKTCISLTLWGSEAERFQAEHHPVVAVKGARVSDFAGRSLSLLMSSQMMINPDIRDAHVLRGWYDCEGHKEDFEGFRSDQSGGGGFATNWKLISEIKGGSIGMSDKPDYHTIKGTTLFFRKENCLYTACPSESCNKKMVDQGNGNYRCEKCNKEYDTFKWRVILSANIADFTDNHWVTCFQDSAETLLGVNANDLGEMKQSDQDAFEKVFQEATFKCYTLRIRSKMESYNDESRLKSVCMQASPLDYREYNKKLIEDIEKISA